MVTLYSFLNETCASFLNRGCYSLEAKAERDGAYNVYESELWQNIIISRLDTVVANFHEIQRNQGMLYDALRETNSKLDKDEYVADDDGFFGGDRGKFINYRNQYGDTAKKHGLSLMGRRE